MRTRKRIVTREISVETTETILIRRSRPSSASWCVQCGREAEMLSMDQAAAIRGVTPKWLEHYIASGQVHSSEPEIGILLVCLPSLMLLEAPLQLDAESSPRDTGRPRRRT